MAHEQGTVVKLLAKRTIGIRVVRKFPQGSAPAWLACTDGSMASRGGWGLAADCDISTLPANRI